MSVPHNSYIYIKNTVDGKRFKFVSKTEIRNLTGARIDQFLTAGAGVKFPYRVAFNGRVIAPTDVLRDIPGIEVGCTLTLEAAPVATAAEQQQQQQSQQQAQQGESMADVIGDAGGSPSSRPSSSSQQHHQQQQQQQHHQSSASNAFSAATTTWIYIRNPGDNNKKYKFVSRANVQDLTVSRVKQFMFAAASLPEEDQTISFNGKVLKNRTVLRHAGVEVGSTLVVTVPDVQEQFKNAISHVALAARMMNGSHNGESPSSGAVEPMASTYMHSVNNLSGGTPDDNASMDSSTTGSPAHGSKTSLIIKYPEFGKTYKFVSSHNVYELTGVRVKNFIAMAAGVEVGEQIVRFRGLVLGDDEALADIGIHPGAVLTLDKLPAQEAIRKFWYTHINELAAAESSTAVADEMVMGSIMKQKEQIFEASCKEIKAMVVFVYQPLESDAADPLLKFRKSVSATVALETVVNLPDENEQQQTKQQQGDVARRLSDEDEEVTPEKQLQYLLSRAAEDADPSATAETYVLEDHEHELPPPRDEVDVDEDDEQKQQQQHQQQTDALSPQQEEEDNNTRFFQQLARKHEAQQQLFLEYETRRRVELTADHYTIGLLRLVSDLEEDIRGTHLETEDRWFQRNVVSDDAIIMAKLHTQTRVQRRVDAKTRLDAAVEKAKAELEAEYQQELEDARNSDFAVRFRRAANKAHEFLREETHLMFETGKMNALVYFGLDATTATTATRSSNQQQADEDDSSRGASADSPTRDGSSSKQNEESSVARSERRAVQLAQEFSAVTDFLE